ncbi:DUF167 family protein [Stappia albiluteola]|uniref:DUF167 family protein n=1 Tax=Stappia albiluteola TaxID=2758565 RepID=UPI002E2D384D|nr:DUF167 family protein [Stappia albiluteola]
MGAADLPWQACAGGLRLAVRVTPKAGRDEIAGVSVLSDGRPVLLVKVRAIPDKGAANEAVARLLAAKLKLPKSAVRLESGATARLKILTLDGDAQQIAADLRALAVVR